MIQGVKRYRLQKIRLDEKVMDQECLKYDQVDDDEFAVMKYVFERG
jgi:hypothetical protein